MAKTNAEILGLDQEITPDTPAQLQQKIIDARRKANEEYEQLIGQAGYDHKGEYGWNRMMQSFMRKL